MAKITVKTEIPSPPPKTVVMELSETEFKIIYQAVGLTPTTKYVGDLKHDEIMSFYTELTKVTL